MQSIGVVGVSRSNPKLIDDHDHQNQDDQKQQYSSKEGKATLDNNSMQARALITVFGMQEDGRIRKEKARQVVARLGLLRAEEGGEEPSSGGPRASFDLPGEDHHEEEAVVAAEEVLGGGGDELLLRRAFEIFDENGNGFIEAMELKRVLECLGLDCGWGMDEVEKMLRVVDLNFDGKVDFGEFELMMMGMNNYSH